MAKINGLSLKKVRYFEGREGTVAQGDLYLGSKKIAFWSQDADGCIEDYLDMEPEFSERKLRQAIIAAHPEKHEEKIAKNGQPYSLDYELESLMTDLLSLMEIEKDWKKAVKEGFAGLFEITDGFHAFQWKLPKSLYDSGKRTVDAVASLIPQQEIEKARAGLFRNQPHTKCVYWTKDDFVLEPALKLNEIRVDA